MRSPQASRTFSGARAYPYPGDLHVVVHAREDRRLDKEALVAEALAACDAGGFFLADINILHDLIELFAADLSALLGLRIEGVAQPALLGSLLEFLDELIVDTLFNQQSTARTAHFALVKEDAGHGALHGAIDIGVGEHNVRRARPPERRA